VHLSSLLRSTFLRCSQCQTRESKAWILGVPHMWKLKMLINMKPTMKRRNSTYAANMHLHQVVVAVKGTLKWTICWKWRIKCTQIWTCKARRGAMTKLPTYRCPRMTMKTITLSLILLMALKGLSTSKMYSVNFRMAISIIVKGTVRISRCRYNCRMKFQLRWCSLTAQTRAWIKRK